MYITSRTAAVFFWSDKRFLLDPGMSADALPRGRVGGVRACSAAAAADSIARAPVQIVPKNTNSLLQLQNGTHPPKKTEGPTPCKG